MPKSFLMPDMETAAVLNAMEYCMKRADFMIYRRKTANITILETNVLIPAPRSPISGNPALPYISTQLPMILSMLPPMSRTIDTTGWQMPSVNCFKVLNPMANSVETATTA